MRADALERYRHKRDFDRTPEPRAKPVRATKKSQLRFVIQKHWASRLHYDFRLELDGTLKSWAVPKGPSLDPKVKRMAVEVEDHPLDYAGFEGEIPEGEYGAGKVMVWDEGSWEPIGDPAKSYREGRLKFQLRGHKLQGQWALVRMAARDGKRAAWLLIKERDALARSELEYSVVDEQPDSVKHTPRKVAAKQRAPSSKSKAQAQALPKTLAPQLATLVKQAPVDAADWIFEIKFDGYRMLARVEGHAPQLLTRNGNDWTKPLSSLAKAVKALKLPDGWYDGEIVVPDEQGLPDFGALQNALDGEGGDDIVFYLFDLPFCEGEDLRGQPLHRRRARLQEILQKRSSERLRFSQEFTATARDLVSSACQLGLEGIIGKRRDSTYRGQRSDDWIKLKCSQRQEFVIGGCTDPEGARKGFGALLLGVHDDKGRLRYAGKVGTGFDDRALKGLHQQLTAIASRQCPFVDPDAERGVHWVKPRLIAEVSFGSWTKAGRIRHASFHALRSDKPPKAIIREVARAAPGKRRKADDVTLLDSGFRITHPERVIDAESGVDKAALVRYYGLVAPLMLAHLRDRPVALVRAPAGVGGELFFQKHAETEKLPGVRMLDRALEPGHAPMLVVDSALGLQSAAQWNVIELHTRNALSTAFETPDRLIFDLDPGEGVDFKAVKEAAEILRHFVAELGLVPWLKTSGGKGLHVVVPIKPVQHWDTAKDFSKVVAAHLAKVVPQRFVAVSGPKNRIGRIFVDYLRNSQAATTAAAWSARARPGMGISVPLDWSELKGLKSAAQWRVDNVHTRLDVGNAPWKKYRASAKPLAAAIRKLAAAR